MDELDFLKQTEVQDFIQSKLNSDPQKLILNPPSEYRNQIKVISNQIIARGKAKGKLTCWHDNPRLIFPPPLSVEQASSEATSRYKSRLFSGKKLIDLTGGMGIDCLALSQRFDETAYVEKSTPLCRLFHHNLSILGQERIEVFNDSAESFLKKYESKAHFFLDPARRDHANNKVFRLEDCSPDLRMILGMLKEKSVQVMIKLSPLLDISSILREFSHVSELHVISVKNDCKELLLLINFEKETGAKILAVNLESNQIDYEFHQEDEKNCEPNIGELKSYIYEPNASILKAGAFKCVAKSFNLYKLGHNTHLYTSEEIRPDFPGKVFQYIAKGTKDNIQSYTQDGCLNVITRNYPLAAPELKKNYKLKDGGNHFLIGYRDLHDKTALVIASRVGL